MSLQIVGNNLNLTTQLLKILTHYFPPPSPPHTEHPSIQVDTKYYTCNVPIKIISFDDQNTNQEKKQQEKIDVLLFLFNDHEQIEGIAAGIDRWMGMLRPQSAIICVNHSKVSEGEWRYQEDVAACENFVPVLYENMQEVGNKLPQWSTNGSLLKNQQQWQIFSLLELIQTTTWTHSQQKLKNNQTKHPTQTVSKPTLTHPQQQQGQFQQQQLTQQQMQKQMLQFELLMQQMMEVKTLPVSGNDRKKKAEELITKLAKSMGQ